MFYVGFLLHNSAEKNNIHFLLQENVNRFLEENGYDYHFFLCEILFLCHFILRSNQV